MKRYLKGISVKDGKQVIEVSAAKPNMPCGECNDSPRAPGSRTCSDCSIEYKKMIHNDERLKKRVEKARQEKE